MSFRSRFEERLNLDLDPFQVEALASLDKGESVLVAAPTGSGKTIVGLYAAVLAVDSGLRAFYTTPLKALSNQKYHEMAAFFPPDQVGLLTGDNSINPDAPVVVMTTEVLRNMIYASPGSLADLGTVVLDEVHYLQNPYRGAVWEEVIIHLPSQVSLVCLSATVSNVDDFAGWMRAVRGQMSEVVAVGRPVPLEHRYLFGLRRTRVVESIPVLVDGSANPRGAELDPPWLARGRRSAGPSATGVRRPELVEYLASSGELPAICFIFSRAGCEAAANEVVLAGVRLTTSAERGAIREIVDSRLTDLDPADLEPVGFPAFITQLEVGVAPHHAGMFPPFREIVEACFERSLVKLVFATETLSLGINMPAKSVVIDRAVKFNGESHQLLTPGEYTQFSGRAGRRGIDLRGTGYVVWSSTVSFEEVASMVVGDSYPITSSFRPTYNMAANLIKRYDVDRARQLLNLSFAQFNEDAEVVRLEAELRRLRARAVTNPEEHSRALPVGGAQFLPGSVVSVPAEGPGRKRASLVVVSVANRGKGELRVQAVSPSGRRYLLSGEQLGEIRVHSQLTLPHVDRHRKEAFRREAGRALKRSLGSHHVHEPSVAFLQGRLVGDRTGTRIARLEERVHQRRGALSAQLDRVLEILDTVGFVVGWSLTLAGGRLSQIYAESDLLIALFFERADVVGVTPAELAAICSWFIFEPRPSFPGTALGYRPQRLRGLFEEACAIASELGSLEQRYALPITREPEPGFSQLMLRWAGSQSLERTLYGSEIPPGDFVRNVKQVADLLRQLGVVFSGSEIGSTARRAEELVVRGVIALSCEVSVPTFGATNDDRGGAVGGT
ncbi:MAG: DEAD/DEAH box helicase [Ferrimicrobium sp.]